jgi:hypothetical protein
VVVDCLRDIAPPFSPESAVEDLTRTLAAYNVTTIQGDRYAGQWPVESFIRFNVVYEQSAQPKSDLYRDMLPLLNSQRVALLDNQKLVNQLTSLERRVARGGRDSIDHPPSGHDDLCNAVAGLCAMLRDVSTYDDWSIAYSTGSDTAESAERNAKEWRRLRLQSFMRSMGMPL